MVHGLVPGRDLLATRPQEQLARPPTHGSATAWVLAALFMHAQGRQPCHQHHAGSSSSPFVHACGCQKPIFTCAWAPCSFLSFQAAKLGRLGSSNLEKCFVCCLVSLTQHIFNHCPVCLYSCVLSVWDVATDLFDEFLRNLVCYLLLILTVI